MDTSTPLRTLYPYQRDTLEQISNRTRVPLFWKMRLGKSIVAVRWITQFQPQPKRVLIICPKTVITSWKEELNLEQIPHLVFSSEDKEFHSKFYHCWVICHYELLRTDNIQVHKLPWDAIILDESTKIKNPQTKISKLITDPSSFPLENTELHPYKSPLKTQLRAVLTGTPAPETYLEYFQQFKFLFGKMGQYTNYFRFRYENFETSWEKPGKYVPRWGFDKKIAKYLSSTAFILSREQVGMHLPHIYEKRFVQLPADTRKIYKEMEENWYSDFLHEILDSGLGGQSPAQLETKFATVAQNYLHQLAIGYPKKTPTFRSDHKLKELVSILKEELYDEKVVIWCRYQRDIDILRKELPVLADRHCREITGASSTEHIQRTLTSFRLPDDVDTVICQIQKAAMGIDLSAADTQIFFSRSWSAMINEQATDRLIHPEKKKLKEFDGLLTIDLITEDTIDEDLYHALIEKKAQASVYKYFLKRTKFDSSLPVKV